MKHASSLRTTERGSAAGVVALLLLAAVVALAAYVAWGLLLTPHLVSLAPNPAAEKSAVVIKGSRFAPYPGGNIVLFGDQTGKVVRSGVAELEVQVPELGLAEGRQARVPVRVLVEGRVSESVELTIGMAPTPIPAPTPMLEPSESPEPEPTPAPTASAVPTRAAAEPKPKPTPPAPTPTPKTFLDDAEAAAAAGDFAQAAELFSKVLQQDAANAKAKAGLDSAKAALASLSRSFVLGKTQVGGAAARGDIKAFDTRDVSVRKPPEVPGRLDIEVSQARVKPGDVVHLRVWLQNEGGKAIKIQALNVATTVDTVRSSGPVASAVREVPARQRALITEISENWKGASSVWRLEVQVTSDRGETYTNILSWK